MRRAWRAWRFGAGREHVLGRGTRRARGRAGVRVAALALLGPLVLPQATAGSHQLSLPSARSVRSAAVRLADWVSGRQSPAPSVPVQQAGSAAGLGHSVPASAARDVSRATGRAPGKGRGQQPPYAPHGVTAHEFTSGPARYRGFDAKTSVLEGAAATARSDLYKNADGSYTRRVYAGPVNYQAPSGGWAPIDETLVKGAGGRWRERANSVGASFAATGSDPVLGELVSGGGAQSVSFSLAGAASVAGVASGPSVTYPSVLPGTDVTETATATGISEALTLHSAGTATSWVFPMRLTGLTASLHGDSVDLADSAGKVAWVIPPAVARSGPVNLATADSQASSRLSYQLVTYDGGPALEMTLDKSWLDAPGRVFPVVIDPTYSPNPSGSTYVQSLSGTAQTADNGGSEFLPSGTVTDSNGTFEDIDFLDFSGLVGDQIPDQHVTAASLHLFDVWAYQCTYTEDVYAYQVTSSWAPSDSLTYPGPSYGAKDAQWTGLASSAACTNTSGLPGQGAWVSLGFNSTGLGLLNDWTLATGVPNYGFAVAPSLTDEEMWKQFDSANDGAIPSSDGGDCSGNCEPYLEMTYTPDVAPQVNEQYPPDNYNSPTLTPELLALGSDADSWPDPLQYDFTVYSSSGTKIVDSGLQPSGWRVPSGDLAWGKSYYWTVRAYDGLDYSSTTTSSYFSTPVPQPLVTSGLSQNGSAPGFSAQSGDYTTSATDAKVATAGPALDVTRDYNSQDPRRNGAFGAGWSSVLDMSVTPGEDDYQGAPETQVVTYPDGQQVAFGLNSGGTYAAPPGRYATLTAVTGGFTLTDKNDTVYAFKQALPSGGYGITSVTDAFGNAETFTYDSAGEVTTITSASGRTLAVSWATPSGASYPHVASVVTGDATAGDSSTAETWTYSYSGDELSAVCPPTSATACTAYAYTAGSDYPESVLNSGPHSYWRLDDPSGSATAASSVLLNEGTDDGSYSNVTLAADPSGLAGSSATVASFNGTSSDVALPTSLGVNQAMYMSVSLWFKTTATNGVLFSYQRDPLSDGTTIAGYTPAVYIGSDGYLKAQFWDNDLAPMTSPGAVNDGNWHQVVMTASGNSQVLYLDGKQVATKSGTIVVTGQQYGYLGAGFLGGSWPDEPHYQENGPEGYATYYSGDLSDAALWHRSLTPAEVTAMYAAGTRQASLLTQVTRPSGSVYAQVSYDGLTGRATSVTDANGGTWTISPPVVSGSSKVYAASVLGDKPRDYWRLADSGNADAVDQVLGGTAAYNDVTEGVTGGPFSDATVDSFNGTDSYLSLPSADRATTGPGTIGLWFKTTGSSEVLYSTQNVSIASDSTSAGFTPSLYVGADGKLNGEFWVNDIADTLSSKAAVNDGKWHYAVLSAGTGTQSLYVDGVLQGTVAASLVSTGTIYVAVGAGYLGGAWPDIATTTIGVRYFTGDIAEVAWYDSQLSATQVAAQWDASKYSTGLTPVQTDTVKNPGGHTMSWTYDLLHGGRVVSQTDADGAITSYGYDVDGFQDEVVNPGRDVEQTGYDVRGNVVSRTTCQDQATDACSTSYYTYYPDDTSTALSPDARNDVLLTSRDPRSSSNSDTAYETSYTYNTQGDLTAETTPPVAGFPSGRTTTYAYTDGSTTAGGYDGAVPPAGLRYQVTTPGGAVTTTLYDAAGDVAQVTDPDGLRTTYAYDGLGRRISKTVYSTSYPNGLATTYAYNAVGEVTSETDPTVINRVTGAKHTAQTTTAYDADGNVTSQTVADTTGGDASRTVTRTYDSHDLLASETDAAGATTSYTYNAYGKIATQTGPDGNVTSYAYDGIGNLVTTTLEDYTGSPPGSQAAAPLVEDSRTYGPDHWLVTDTDAMGRVTYYKYTDNGLVASVDRQDQAGTQFYTTQVNTYDPAGNLTEQVTNNNATTTTYTVDAANRVTSKTLDPSGLDRTTTTTYTPDDYVASRAVSAGGSTVSSESYGYDPMGNVTSQSVADAGAGGPVAWFPLTQSSGTAVPDSAPGGQPATASGVTWTGTSASFAAASGQQVATAGPVLDTTGSFTVAAWVDLAGDTTASQTVLSQDAGTDSGFYLKYYPGTGGWQFMRPLTDTANPATANANSDAAAVTGTWTFLVGTYDAGTGTMTLYVNGTASSVTGSDPTPVAAHGPLAIGRGKWDGSATDFLDGQVANVQAYPRALSAAEVSALYANGQAGSDITAGTLTTTWTRGERGLPTSVTGPDGNVTDYSYDAAGQLAVTTEPPVMTETYGNSPVSANPVSMTGYDTFGDVSETEDPDGNVTTYGYDADGRQVSRTMPPYTPPGASSAVTAVYTRAYDGLGQVTSSTDALGNTTTYAYDQLGDQVSKTLPDGSAYAYAYDADGEQLSATGPTGAETEATYDFMGRKATDTQVERYNPTGTTQAYTTDYAYKSWLSQVTAPDGEVTKYVDNAAGELSWTTDPAGNYTKYAYDGLGRQTTVTYPDGTSQATGYDAAGDVTSVKNLDASGNTLTTTTATYDGNGNQLSATDALGDTSTFTYDATGVVTQEVQPVSASSGITTSFGYDAAGNQTRYTDGDGSNWYYTYNPWGLQESRIEPATAQYTTAADSTFTTAYDANGDPVTQAEPGGVTVTSTYNNVGEMTGQSGAGADAATASRSFGYDAAGNMTSAATSNTASSGSNATSESFTYDDRGNVLTSSGTAGSTTYTYNGNSQVLSVADAAGTTSYSYDSAGRLSTLADPATGTTATYTYNSMSQVTGVSYGTGADTRALSYDSLHRLTGDTLQTSTGTTVASIAYGYDANGQVTSVDTTGLAGPAASTYGYDQAGRLTSWDNGTTTTSYGYDANGNLTQDGSKTQTYDARDQLTSDGTNTYTYTARGTPSSEVTPSGTVASTFDAYGTQATAGTQAYTHDALGRMTSDVNTSTLAGNAFTYEGSTGTIASDGASTYTWGPSGASLAGIGTPGGTSGVLALANVHGDVVGQFTAAGTAVSGSAAYGPWGTVTATTGALAGQVGYQSGWTDAATGKVAMGSRWYSPSAGGFISADTVQVSPVPDAALASPFAYAGDNPLTGMDPSGHWCAWGCFSHWVSHTFDTARHSASHKFDVFRHWTAHTFDTARHSVSHRFDTFRHWVSHTFDSARHTVAKVLRPVVNLGHAVIDAAKRGANAARTYIEHTSIYKTATKWAGKTISKGESLLKTAWRKSGAQQVVTSLAHGAERTAGWVGSHVQKAAAVTGKALASAATATGSFLAKNGAAIGGMAASMLTMAGCEAITDGAGSIGCSALAGAVGNAVTYGINAAQSGKFSWSALGETTLNGAIQGATSDGFGGEAEEAETLATEESTAEADAAAADTAEEEPPAEEEPAGGSCPVNGGLSFTAATPVLLASGKAEPISKLRTGQKVLATDTKTGKDQPETVTAVLLHHDTDLYDLKVSEHGRAMVIDTTSNHLFWVPGGHGHGRWVKAAALKHGTHLRTPGGHDAVVTGGYIPRHHDGWMWDLTVPGNNDHDFYVLPAQLGSSLHTYHVVTGSDVPILVHNNSDLCGKTALENGDWQHIVDRHRPGGRLVDDKSGIFTGKSKAVRQKIAETIDRGTPMPNTPDPITDEPRPGKVYSWDFGIPVGKAGPAKGGGDLTGISVVVNEGKVVTAFPF